MHLLGKIIFMNVQKTESEMLWTQYKQQNRTRGTSFPS